MTYCSACRSLLSPGAAHCAHCGLPLTALAMAAPAARKQGNGAFFWLAVIPLPLVVFLAMCGQMDQEHASAAAVSSATRDAKAAAGPIPFWNALDAIATPEAFAERCGKPERILRTRDGAILSYPITNDLGRIGTERVILQHDHPKVRFRVSLHEQTLTDSPEDGLNTIGCKIP
jgi:hypothetical protein